MSEVLSATNLKILAQGMWMTLYLSFHHHPPCSGTILMVIV